MATVKFYLKEPKSLKETLIFLACTSGEHRFKFYTQRKILPKYWDAKSQLPRKSFSGSPELKSYLKSLAGDTEKILTQFRTLNQPFTLEQVKRKLNVEYDRKPTKQALSFFSFVEDFIESVKNLRASSTIKKYHVTLRLIREFQKYFKSKIDFNTIDLDFYNGFTQFMMQDKNFSSNTIGLQIKNLKVFLNEATERGLNTKFDFRSKRFKVPKDLTESIYLNEDDLLRIYELDLSANKRLEKIRDLFIVGCYTGLRFSDFSRIKPENINGDLISIRTQKTDQPVVIPIHWMVKKIMSRYKNSFANSLPPASSNQKMNEYLKEVGRLAGLNENILVSSSKGGRRSTHNAKKFELITTHTARRSFATNLFLAEYESISIMKITGHKTQKAFLNYIKVTPEENALKLKKFWNNNLQLKVV